MYKPESWAEAFVNTAGTAGMAEEALEILKVFCRAALRAPGYLSGTNDANRFGKTIQNALIKCSKQKAENSIQSADPQSKQSLELAERFILLMLQKKCFKQYKEIINRIEKRINGLNGIEEVTVESPVKMDGSFIADIKEKAKYLTGAKAVKISVHLVPELIGGLRIRFGSRVFDGTIKHALYTMATNLETLNSALYLENKPGA